VLGRDFEIRQVIDILTRRRQNNPILTGEAGVERLRSSKDSRCALRKAMFPSAEECNDPHFWTWRCCRLAPGEGEFENRLKGLIEEVKASPIPIILFIDEAHTMIGAGGQAGQNDAANLLNRAGTRAELRTIAATTWSEYKNISRKDPALGTTFPRL